MTGTRVLIGGDGQLGRMLALAGQSMGLRMSVLGPDPDSPAAQVCSWVRGDYRSAGSLLQAGLEVDVTVIEFEDVNAIGLGQLHRRGKIVSPSGTTLTRMKDKLLQKEWAFDHGAPTMPFRSVSNSTELADVAKLYDGHVMVKKRLGSYDGYGNYELNDTSLPGAEAAYAKLGDTSELYGEAFMPFAYEIAVVLTRSVDGEIVTYPVVKTVQENGVCLAVTGPFDRKEPRLCESAKAIAAVLVDELEYVGTMAVEFLVMADGTLLYNEMALRVHNSGHWTLNAPLASQFENHLRAVMGWPLGGVPEVVAPFAMVNILGAQEPGEVADVAALPEGWEDAFEVPGVHLWWYGKRQAKRGRKLGHINAVCVDANDTVDDLLRRAFQASDYIKI